MGNVIQILKLNDRWQCLRMFIDLCKFMNLCCVVYSGLTSIIKIFLLIFGATYQVSLQNDIYLKNWLTLAIELLLTSSSHQTATCILSLFRKKQLVKFL
jgi:uncharacterized membrane protein